MVVFKSFCVYISDNLENLDDSASRLSSISKEIGDEKSRSRHFNIDRSKDGSA
jgi:hypothetical protein